MISSAASVFLNDEIARHLKEKAEKQKRELAIRVENHYDKNHDTVLRIIFPTTASFTSGVGNRQSRAGHIDGRLFSASHVYFRFVKFVFKIRNTSSQIHIHAELVFTV